MKYKVIIVGVLVLCVLLIPLSNQLFTQEEKVDLGKADLKQVLEKHVGKKVTLILTSGGTIGGKLAMVGKYVVHLTELTGKDYFDAVIDLKTIGGIDYRVKG